MPTKKRNAIELPHAPKSGSVGRNLAFTVEEKARFDAELALHQTKTASKLIPGIQKDLAEYARKRFEELNQGRRTTAPEVTFTTWLFDMDFFILKKMRLEKRTFEEARENRNHETRLTNALTSTIFKKTIPEKTASQIIARALEQNEERGPRANDREAVRMLFEKEQTKLSLPKNRGFTFDPQTLQAAKRLNRMHLEKILGKPFSEMYSTLYEESRRILNEEIGKTK